MTGERPTVEFPDGDTLEVKVDCTRCGRFTSYELRDGDPETVVRCGACGKRHSRDSLHAV